MENKPTFDELMENVNSLIKECEKEAGSYKATADDINFTVLVTYILLLREYKNGQIKAKYVLAFAEIFELVSKIVDISKRHKEETPHDDGEKPGSENRDVENSGEPLRG